MGSTARLAEEFHSHFTEYEKFDDHAEVSVRLMRRELPQSHWVGYEGLGFDVCDTRLRSLTVALPDDKTREKATSARGQCAQVSVPERKKKMSKTRRKIFLNS